MKKTFKFMLLGSLLGTTVLLAPVALAADSLAESNAYATFIDENIIVEGGHLRFDKNNQPTPIQFGQIFISGDTTTYSAIYYPINLFTEYGEEAVVAPLNVTTIDNRGSNKGWTMKVKLSEQFKSVQTNSVLKGATLTLTSDQAKSTKLVDDRVAPAGFHEKVELSADKEFETIMEAATDTGVGTWTTMFGKTLVNDGTSHIDKVVNEGKANEYTYYTTNDNVQLTVPGGVNKVEEAYKAQLTWELSSTPDAKP